MIFLKLQTNRKHENPKQVIFWNLTLSIIILEAPNPLLTAGVIIIGNKILVNLFICRCHSYSYLLLLTTHLSIAFIYLSITMVLNFAFLSLLNFGKISLLFFYGTNNHYRRQYNKIMKDIQHNSPTYHKEF